MGNLGSALQQLRAERKQAQARVERAVMTLDIGSVIGDFVVEEQAYDRAGSWFISCPQGHRIFATSQMLEGGMAPRCVECANAFAVKQELLDIRNKRISMEQAQEISRNP